MIDILNKPVKPAVILIAGLIFKILLMLPEWNVPATDLDGYFRVAKTILSHHSFGNPPGYDVVPGYSIYLAIGIMLIGENHLVFFNLPLFAAASWLLIRLLTELGVTVRLWSAGFICFIWFANPLLHFLHIRLLSENAFIPLLLGFALFFLRYMNSGSKASLFVAFFFLAFASWVRPVGVLFPIFFIPGAYIFGKPLRHFFAAMLVYTLLILPWGIRNYLMFNDFNMLSSRYWGGAFWGGNNEFMLYESDDLRGNWLGAGDIQARTVNPELKEKIRLYREILDSGRRKESEDFARKQVYDFWRGHLFELPTLAIHKLKWLWHYSSRHPLNRTWYYDLVGVIWYLIWMPLLIPFFWYREKMRYGAILLGFICYFSAVTMVTFGMVRFRMPVEPLLHLTFIFSLPYVFKSLKR